MDAQIIISRLGGTAKAAELCEVTPSAVSQWLHSGVIPPARRMYLKAVRPEVFVDLDRAPKNKKPRRQKASVDRSA